VVNVAPTLDPIGGASVADGTSFVFAPAVSDPAGAFDPITWSLTGTVPASLILAANGTISWTPSFAEASLAGTSYPMTLTADDGDGGTDSQSFTLIAIFRDGDGDGIADTWELTHGLDPADGNDALAD